MKILKSHSGLCLLYSAAMLLDERPETLAKEIGWSGREIWWPNLAGTRRHRTHHIQEMIDCCLRRGFGLMKIELLSTITPGIPSKPRMIYNGEKALTRFLLAIENQKGILVGETEGGIMHACAWDGKKIYDPRGMIRDLDEFTIRHAWILVSIIKSI